MATQRLRKRRSKRVAPAPESKYRDDSSVTSRHSSRSTRSVRSIRGSRVSAGASATSPKYPPGGGRHFGGKSAGRLSRSWRHVGTVVQAANKFKKAGASRRQRLAMQREKRKRILAEHRRPLIRPKRRSPLGCLSTTFESPTLINDFVLIGDRADAMDKRFLLKCGVTHILNTTKQLPAHHEPHFVYLRLPLVDGAHFDIRPYFEEAANFIEDAVRHRSRILVHCVAGVSRSVSCVLAWMMSRQKMRLNAALRQVERERPIIHPNEGFLMALAMLELELFGSSSVAGSGSKRWNFYKWNAMKGKVPRHSGDRAACTVQ